MENLTGPEDKTLVFGFTRNTTKDTLSGAIQDIAIENGFSPFIYTVEVNRGRGYYVYIPDTKLYSFIVEHGVLGLDSRHILKMKVDPPESYSVISFQHNVNELQLTKLYIYLLKFEHSPKIETIRGRVKITPNFNANSLLKFIKILPELNLKFKLDVERKGEKEEEKRKDESGRSGRSGRGGRSGGGSGDTFTRRRILYKGRRNY